VGGCSFGELAAAHSMVLEWRRQLGWASSSKQVAETGSAAAALICCVQRMAGGYLTLAAYVIGPKGNAGGRR
jgi:hypothetical protein